jgi:hypothetical protein
MKKQPLNKAKLVMKVDTIRILNLETHPPIAGGSFGTPSWGGISDCPWCPLHAN